MPEFRPETVSEFADRRIQEIKANIETLQAEKKKWQRLSEEFADSKMYYSEYAATHAEPYQRTQFTD